MEEGAILAFVITQDGCANLNFYTANSELFLERLNEALADKPPVPIELTGEEDPRWSEYLAVLQAIGRAEDSNPG